MSNRPDQNEGETTRIKTGCGWLYITDCTESEYKEVFIRLGKTGGCAAAFLQALAISVSLGLRAGVPKERFIDLFKDIRCPTPCWYKGEQVLSCPDGIAKMLRGKV